MDNIWFIAAFWMGLAFLASLISIRVGISVALIEILLGVVVGNILRGVELGPDHEFQGHWLDFLNPYSLLVGLTTLALFMMEGALYLAMKTEGKLFSKVNDLLKKSILVFIVAYVIVTIWSLLAMPHLTDNLLDNTALFIVPLLAFLSIANVPRLVSKGKYVQAFLFSALTMSFLLILVAIELYPVMVPSTVDPANSITVYNAASSEKSLQTMLILTAIGAPLVVLYTIFVYRTFWGKVKMDETSY